MDIRNIKEIYGNVHQAKIAIQNQREQNGINLNEPMDSKDAILFLDAALSALSMILKSSGIKTDLNGYLKG